MGNPDRPDRRVVQHTDAIDEVVTNWERSIMPGLVSQSMVREAAQLAHAKDVHSTLVSKASPELALILEQRWPELMRSYLRVVDAGAVVKGVRGKVEESAAGIYVLNRKEVALSQEHVRQFAELLRFTGVQLEAQTQQFIPETGGESNVEELLERVASSARNVTDGTARLSVLRSPRDPSSINLQEVLREYLDNTTALNRLSTAVALRSASARSGLSAEYLEKVAQMAGKYGKLTPEQEQILLASADKAVIGTRTNFAALDHRFDNLLEPRARVNLETLIPPLKLREVLRKAGGPNMNAKIALVDRFDKARPRNGTRGK